MSFLRRGLRLADTYLNMFGHGGFVPRAEAGVLDVPSSRFLRPYARSAALLEPLRVHRITRSMTIAARRGESFHLWWHPHNFGANLGANLGVLEHVLGHHRRLRDRFGMEPATMGDIVAARRIW